MIDILDFRSYIQLDLVKESYQERLLFEEIVEAFPPLDCKDIIYLTRTGDIEVRYLSLEDLSLPDRELRPPLRYLRKRLYS